MVNKFEQPNQENKEDVEQKDKTESLPEDLIKTKEIIDNLYEKEEGYEFNQARNYRMTLDAFKTVYPEERTKLKRIKEINKVYKDEFNNGLKEGTRPEQYYKNMAIKHLFENVFTDNEKENFKIALQKESERQGSKKQGMKMKFLVSIENSLGTVFDNLPDEKATVSEDKEETKPKTETIEIETREVQISRYKEELEKLRKKRDELMDEEEIKNKGKKLRNLNSEIIELEEKLEFFKSEEKEPEKEKELEKQEEQEKLEDLEEKKELILDDVRREYARIDLDAEKYIKENKGKFKNDFEGYEEAKSAYLEAVQNQRVRMYKDAVEEIEGLCFPESEKEEENKKMKEKMEEIVKETIVKEADRLHNQKMDLKLETKEGSGKFEKIKNITGKVVEKYRRMPLYKKLLISGGLLAGGLAAGAAGGATGAALVTGVVAGKWAQRVLGGAATAVGLEALIKRSQEKKEGKETLAELADKLEESIKNNDKKLDEKLLKLEGSKKGQKTKRYILAGTAGVLVGSGLIGKVVGGIWGGEGTEEVTEKVVEQAQAEGVGKVAEQAQVAGFIETVGKGDSVWKMAEDQLEKHYGEEFIGLDKATQTHLIDAIKDKVAENPEKFGLEDIDKLKVGQKVDFSSIIEDSTQMDEMSKEAGNLVDSEKASILSNNNKIEEWANEHPKEELTTEKVDEILSGKTEIAPDADMTDVEKSMIDQEHPTTEQAALETQINKAESKIVESLGFTPDEYNAMESIKVGHLLEQLPSEFEAWEMWRDTPVTDIDLPHDGIYSSGEFGRQVGLAEYIRSLNPDEGVKQMTIRQFMRIIASK